MVTKIVSHVSATAIYEFRITTSKLFLQTSLAGESQIENQTRIQTNSRNVNIQSDENAKKKPIGNGRVDPHELRVFQAGARKRDRYDAKRAINARKFRGGVYSVRG